MRTFWLDSEDDSRIQERINRNEAKRNPSRSSVTPDLICNNNTDLQQSPNRQAMHRSSLRTSLRQRGCNEMQHSEQKPQTHLQWVSNLPTMLHQNEKYHLFDRKAKSNDTVNYMSSPKQTIGDVAIPIGNKLLQPYLNGSRNGNRIYCYNNNRTPRSAPQITFNVM